MARSPDHRSRRRFLRDAASGLAAFGLAGCSGGSADPAATVAALKQRLLGPRAIIGGFVGQAFERGHRLRDPKALPAPDETRRTDVAIIGTGIAGLAAARAVQAGHLDDYRLFELEDDTGGNSRGGLVAGFACPWGAHYLPTPGPAADDVAALLDEYRLRTVVGGQVQYDERQLCHAPQERLYLDGRWHDGLLPVQGQPAATLDQYRRFASLIAQETQPGRFTIPTSTSRWDERLTALDAMPFSAWLDGHGLDAPALRTYLDYCCRDDYGAGTATVSAWAGLHYFISRHGFDAPHEGAKPDDDVLTWPEGNAWLARRLAEPHRSHTQTGALVLKIEDRGADVAIDVLDVASQRLTRWLAKRAVIATPLFVAARLVASPPDALAAAARAQPHSPWLVANLHIDAPLAASRDEPPLSWDNVIHGSAGLGYVNAMNQSTRPHDGATVLTYYRAFGDDPAAGREALLKRGWEDWAAAIVRELSAPHPDLRGKLREVQIMRYGHAMAIPSPGVRSSAWLAALREPIGRLAFAHADLSAYSVFEEAFDRGLRAGRETVKRLG